MSRIICKTERLILQELNLDDADFIIELVNTPDWLTFIGDRNIHSIKDAKSYIVDGPLTSYEENGYGLWKVVLKSTNALIGICGILKRSYLDYPDIGFAFLPQYYRKGYGVESASATMDHAKYVLELKKVVAITSPDNQRSQKLLHKIGLTFEKELSLKDDEIVHLYSPFSDKNS